MNRHIISCFATIAIAMAAVSCVDDIAPGGDRWTKPLEITASCQPESGKTQMGDNFKVEWNAGDAISVFDGTGNRKFETLGSGVEARFKGNAHPVYTYYVLYPYNETASFKDGIIQTEILERQEASTDSFQSGANISVGKSTRNDDGISVSLCNVLAAFKIVIPDGSGNISSVLIKSNGGELLSGRTEITYNDGKDIKVEVNSGKPWVRLVPPTGAASFSSGTYYACLPPSVLAKGVTVIFERADKAVAMKVSEARDTLRRSCIKDLGMSPSDFEATPAGLYDYSRLTEMTHPRLIMTGEGFANLKKRLDESDPTSALVIFHKFAMDYAKDQLARRTDACDQEDGIKYYENISDYNNQALSGIRQMMSRIVSSAYAFRMTGNEDYLKCARYYLDLFRTYPDWHSANDLTRAEAATAVAIGYDWLYYDLEPEFRANLEKSLRDKAILSLPECTVATNINQVRNCGLTLACIAAYDADRKTYAAKLEESVNSNMNHGMNLYKPDGNTNEGYGYWDYGTEFQALMIQALLSAFNSTATSSGINLEDAPGFQKTPEFILYMTDSLLPFRFSDGSVGKIRPKQVIWWFAARYQNPSLLVTEVPQLTSKDYNQNRLIAMYPCYLSLYKELDYKAGHHPTAKLWTGEGSCHIAFVRPTWNNDESDIYLAVKGGKARNNHGHMDAGSIALSMSGIRWIDEMPLKGSYYEKDQIIKATFPDDQLGYSSTQQLSHRWDIFVTNNLAHSTVSVMSNDGSITRLHPSDHCADGAATIMERYDSDASRGVKMDMGQVLKGQVKSASRKVVLKDNKYVEISDEITAPDGKDAIVQIRYVSPLETTQTKVASSDSLVMAQGEKALCIKFYVDCDADGVVPNACVWQPTRPVSDNPQRGEVAFPVIKGSIAEPSYPTYSIVGCYVTIPAGKTAVIKTVIAPGIKTETDADVNAGHEMIIDNGDDYKY